jgi:hypothetical protein
LPTFFKHKKIREFHLKELIGINKILKKEKELLIKAREESVIKILQKFHKKK